MRSVAAAPGGIVVMGRILAPFGVRGWIKVRPLSQAPEALLGFATWWVRSAGDPRWREMRQVAGRVQADALVVELAGVETREAALTLRGCDVGVPRAALPDGAGRGDLLGRSGWHDRGQSRRRDARRSSGVTEHGAHPLLRVARPAARSPERLIPYVPAIVDRVDIVAHRIDVDWGEDY